LEPEEHQLLLTLHHIASDGWSQAILVRELTALYAAFAAGRPSPLPPPPLQYADFAAWQRSWLADEKLAAELGHWRRRLAGAPDVLDLPTDRPRAAVRGTRGGELAIALPEAAGDLARLARQEGVTLFMLLLSCSPPSTFFSIATPARRRSSSARRSPTATAPRPRECWASSSTPWCCGRT
jgi:hypothetical protein